LFVVLLWRRDEDPFVEGHVEERQARFSASAAQNQPHNASSSKNDR